MSESIAAVNADVVWRTNTPEATVDIEKLRRTFHESTAQMSTDTLKLASAQDRLDRALIKHGATSKQARDAEIALRRATAESTVSAEKHSSALRSEERSIERLGRGAIVGSGAVRGLARSVAFASTSFLGGAGLVFGLRKSVDAFREHQTIVARVSNAVKRAGLDYQAYSAQIDKTIQAQARLTAFDDEKLLDTFGRLIVRTKDVNRALELNGLAADVARGRNIDLEAATQIVIKASIGQAGQLRRLGIDVKKTATAQQLLAALQEKYAGAAERFSKTDEGISQRRQKSLQDLEEIIGRGVSPAIEQLDRRFIKWAENDDNLRRVQKDVNEAVKIGGQAAHGLAEGLGAIHDVAVPVVGALGGVESTAKAMVEAFALYKLLKIAGAIKGIGRNAVTTAGQLDTMTAAEGRAARGGAGPRTGNKGGGFGLTGLPAALLVAPFAYPALQQVYREAFGATFGGLSASGDTRPGVDTSTRIGIARELVKEARAQGLSLRQIRALLASRGFTDREINIVAPVRTGEDVALRGAAARTPTTPTRGGGPGRKHGFELPYNLQVEQARAAAGQGSELGAAQDALRYVKAQLAAGRLNKQGVLDALAEEAQLQDQIDAILTERNRKEKARRDKRLAEEKKAQAARDEAARKALALSNRDHTPDLIDRFLATRAKNAAYKNKLTAKKAASGDGIGLGDVSDLFRTYGSNLFGPNAAGSPQDAIAMLAELVMLQRKNNEHAKATASNTKSATKGPNPARIAAHLADVGAWT